LDPREKEDRDAVDAYFAETVLPTIQSLPEDRAVEIVTNFVDKAGIIPSAIKSGIRGGLRSTDAQKRIQAADTLDRLVSRNPALQDDFDNEDFRRGTAISENIRAGMEPARGLTVADKVVGQRDSAQVRFRSDVYRQGGSETRDGNRKRLIDSVGGGG